MIGRDFIRWVLSPLIMVIIGLTVGVAGLRLPMGDGREEALGFIALLVVGSITGTLMTRLLTRLECVSDVRWSVHPRQCFLVYIVLVPCVIAFASHGHTSGMFGRPLAALLGVILANAFAVGRRMMRDGVATSVVEM